MDPQAAAAAAARPRRRGRAPASADASADAAPGRDPPLPPVRESRGAHASWRGAREALVVLGWALWMAAYGVMLWRMLALRAPVWPYRLAAYALVWELADALSPLLGRTARWKVPLHLAYAAMDLCLVLGSAALDGRPAAPREAAAALAAYTLLALALGRRFKYFCFAWFAGNHVAMARMPVYAADPWLRRAAWAQVAANLCYVPKAVDAPAPRWLYAAFAAALPLVGAAATHAIPAHTSDGGGGARAERPVVVALLAALAAVIAADADARDRRRLLLELAAAAAVAGVFALAEAADDGADGA